MSSLHYKELSPSVANAHEAAQIHGVNGIWGTDCGLERGILSTMVGPEEGILSYIPAAPTNIDIIKYGAITGWRPDETPEPDYPCENAPRGVYSSCRLQFELGHIKRDGMTIEITQAISRANRGDEEFFLMGAMNRDVMGGLSSSSVTGDFGTQALNVATVMQMQSIAKAFANEVSSMVWIGDPTAPAPANTEHGGKISFWGLDNLVKTGYRDSVNNNLCPTMDSAVYDFDYENVCDGEITVNGTEFNIVTLLAVAEWRNRSLAESSHLNPVTGVIVMHPALWQELTACYPCLYNTDRCSTNVVLNDGITVRQRDEYRNGMFLPINGKTYIVVTDWNIPVQDATTTPGELSGTELASDIFFIPLRVLGNVPVTWLRYKDFRRAAPERAVLDARGFPLPFVWTDDGKYMLSYEYVNFCYEITGILEPGLVFRTPQLAWRINNVKWNYPIPLRSPIPGDTNFVFDTANQFPVA